MDADIVHAAMGEFEASRMLTHGFSVGVDEPYQHYQFAGRADVVAWSPTEPALLHMENRTRFPNMQETAGSWNAKRLYLPRAMAERAGVRRWASVTNVMVVLWSSEALHTLRLRTATFRALCPDDPGALLGWWAGRPPPTGTTSTLVVLEPAAPPGRRSVISLDDAMRVRPRYRGYAEAADALKRRQPT